MTDDTPTIKRQKLDMEESARGSDTWAANVIFLFRRELRCHDNVGLLRAATESAFMAGGAGAKPRLHLMFVLDKRQVETAKNTYYSGRAFLFMMQSLLHLLQKQTGNTLTIYEGIVEDILDAILMRNKQIQAVHMNEDYTPFAKKVQKALADVCRRRDNVAFRLHTDQLLFPIGSVVVDGGDSGEPDRPYRMFTPFWKKAMRTLTVDRPEGPEEFRGAPLANGDLQEYLCCPELFENKVEEAGRPYRTRPTLLQGGRDCGLQQLHRAVENLTDYDNTRNFPTTPTSRLSVYLKFGCVSVRECFYAFRAQGPSRAGILRQLGWRDFYYHIAHYFPNNFGQPMTQKFVALRWKQQDKGPGAAADAERWFERWKTGTTGFPFVDAGMRALRDEGFLHNRLRMVVASFLIKDLHLDWQWGERFFAQSLVDYDPSQNNGGWQWVAGTGTDSSPYNRVFNPWISIAKFDKDAVFVKRHIPELAKVPAEDILKWNEKWRRWKGKVDYPEPMVDHATERLDALERYRACG